MVSQLDMVLPEQDLSPQVIQLSPLDQQVGRHYIIRLIICFPLEDITASKVLNTLRISLSRTIVAFPSIAGHIVPAQEPGHVALKISSGDGVCLQYKNLAVAEEEFRGIRSYEELKKQGFPLHELPETVVGPVAFMPLVPEKAPALICQCGFMPGGMLLSIAFHHSAFDLKSASIIVAHWAAERRKLSLSTAPKPIRQVQSVHPFDTIGSAYDPDMVDDYATLDGNQSGGHSEPVETTIDIFSFSFASLNYLRDLASPKKQSQAAPRVSINDSLSALLWHGLTRARTRLMLDNQEKTQISENEEIRFALAVDARNRMSPPSPSFVGNASIPRVTSLDKSHLLRNPLQGNGEDGLPLAHTAAKIRQRLDQVNAEYIRHVFAFLVCTPPPTILIPNLNMKYIFWSTNWSNSGFGTEDWGVGLGKPDRVRIPNMPGDGTAVILPKTDHSTGLEVAMCLRKDTMVLMREELRNFVCFLERPTGNGHSV